MSEEIRLAYADMAEVARLTAEVRDLRAALEQKDRALEAAHRKIEMTEVDNAALIGTLEHAARMFTIKGARVVISAALADDSPGESLLAKLDAARAVAAYLNDRRHWRMGTICPTCGFGTKLDGSEFHGSGCPLDAYNKASKAT